MLLKPSGQHFVPSVEGRDYRPYSRACPAPAPAQPLPNPGADCSLVPIYGPGVPGSGGIIDGGVSQPQVVGFQTVCADGTSTTWGATGGGSSNQPAPTPVSTNSVPQGLPVTRALTYFRLSSQGRPWFQIAMSLAQGQSGQQTDGAWLLAYQIQRGTMPSQAFRDQFPTISIEGNATDGYSWTASDCDDVGLIVDGGAGFAMPPMQAPSGSCYICAVLLRTGNPRGVLVDYQGKNETAPALFATPLLPTRTFPTVFTADGSSLTAAKVAFGQDVTVSGAVPGVPKYFDVTIPYRTWSGRIRLTVTSTDGSFNDAWRIACTVVNIPPLLGKYSAALAPAFEIVGQQNEFDAMSGTPRPRQRLRANMGNVNASATLYAAPAGTRVPATTEPMAMSGQDGHVIVGVLALGTVGTVKFKVEVVPQ